MQNLRNQEQVMNLRSMRSNLSQWVVRLSHFIFKIKTYLGKNDILALFSVRTLPRLPYGKALPTSHHVKAFLVATIDKSRKINLQTTNVKKKNCSVNEIYKRSLLDAKRVKNLSSREYIPVGPKEGKIVTHPTTT